MAKIKLSIDGRTVEVDKGKTVLEAAREAGVHIPTLCSHEDLPPYGACRMCIVQIEKVRGFPTSCTTPAEDGMVVMTTNPEIEGLRKRVLELMLSGHPNSCLKCPHREACEKYRPRPTKAGQATRCAFCSNRDACELRALTIAMNPDELDLPDLYAAHKVEKFDPFMDRDHNLCILCGRCFRICEKIHGRPAIAILNRGRWAQIGTSFHKEYTKSGCTFCGACVDICPTGTLTDRYAKWYGNPDGEVLSACAICPEGCEAVVDVKDGKAVALHMKDFQRDSRICAIGRFAYAQLVNSPNRLLRPLVRKDNALVPQSWDEVIAAAAARLKEFPADRVAVIAPECELREVRHLYAKLAQALGARLISAPAKGTVELPASVKAVVVSGNYLDDKALAGLDCLVVIDWAPSPATARAFAVLPAAALSEVEGTLRDQRGAVRSVKAVTKAPGDVRPEWEILRDLGKALGAAGFDLKSVSEVTAQVGDDPKPTALTGKPRDNIADLPVRFRGHYIADAVCALESLGLPMSPPAPEPELAGGFKVIEKSELIPNFHLLTVEAPQVARFAKPGQFAILMVKETSERVPFTLCDWDAEAGTITLIVEEVGRSSHEVAALRTGQKIAHVTGPLGLPLEVKKFGTVVLGGGCYGIGAIYPLARAMKAAGNRVISVIEASAGRLLYWKDKLESVSDKVIVATKDGSVGVHGGVQEVFVQLHKEGKVDQFTAIGCTFMMRMVSEATAGLGAPTYVALNPIMVDGTGMCGACRVSVGGKTKFACVDGPIFDAHQVDWNELFSRRGAYATLEISALPQSAVSKLAEEHDHKCSGNCKGA